MKYNISINQKSIFELTPKITLSECAILDYLFYICSSENEKIIKQRIEKSNEYFTWVNLTTLLTDMPLLHFKNICSISEKITKLEKLGYLKSLTLPDGNGKKLYISLTEQTKSLFVETNNPICLRKQPHLSTQSNNNTNDNNTNDTIVGTSPTLPNPLKEKRKPTDIIDLKEETAKLLRSPQKHIHIIGLWLTKQPLPEATYGALQETIKRLVRPAAKLEGYSDQRILDTIDYIFDESWDDKARQRKYYPTLETVCKKINCNF